MNRENILLYLGVLGCIAIILLVNSNKEKAILIHKVKSIWAGSVVVVGMSIGSLLYAQIKSIFAWKYVYEHTSTDLPILYKISALWAGKEGSFLLWSFVLIAMAGLLIAYYERSGSRAITSYMMITVAILIMTIVSNPFERLTVIPANGAGLNRALQDPWMSIHPPLVFIGYSGMAILFSLGVDTNKIRDIEKQLKYYTKFSMLFLGLGIMTGAVWAYRALGWGGYWAWDPIENVALVPWLIMCMYLHGDVKFTKIKCMIPFIIAAFGTFLTRSGILKDASLHAYVNGDITTSYILLGGFVLVALVLIGMGIRQAIKARSQVNKVDRMRGLRIITYFYATLIIIGTVMPLFTYYELPVSYYNKATIGYGFAVGIILIIVEKVKYNVQLLLTLVIGTILSAFIFLRFHVEFSTISLLAWMYCLIGIWYSFEILKGKKVGYYIGHLGFVVMIIGGIASSGFGNEYMDLIKVKDNQIVVGGKSIELRMFEDNKHVIVHQLTQDMVIQNLQRQDNESVRIGYLTKPLINLFWSGSFGMLGGLIFPLRKRIQKN